MWISSVMWCDAFNHDGHLPVSAGLANLGRGRQYSDAWHSPNFILPMYTQRLLRWVCIGTYSLCSRFIIWYLQCISERERARYSYWSWSLWHVDEAPMFFLAWGKFLLQRNHHAGMTITHWQVLETIMTQMVDNIITNSTFSSCKTLVCQKSREHPL